MSTDQKPVESPPVTGSGEGETQSTTPGSAAELTPESADALVNAILDSEPAQEKVDTTPEAVKPEAPAEPVPAPEAKSETQPEVVTEPEIPVVPHPYDDADDPSVDEVDPKFTKIRANFEKQRERLRKAREDGSFGRELVSLAQREGVSPQQLAELIQRNIRLAKGDPQAISEVAAELHKRGVKIGDDRPDTSAVEAEADRIYKETFAKGVEDRRVDEDYAKAQARAIAEKLVAAKPKVVVPPPAPAQSMPMVDQEVNANIAALDQQIESAYKKAKLDYAPIRAEVLTRIKARAEREGTIPAHLRAYVYNETVRAVQSEMLAKQRAAKVAPVKATNTLAPSTRSNPNTAPSREAFLNDLANQL